MKKVRIRDKALEREIKGFVERTWQEVGHEFFTGCSKQFECLGGGVVEPPADADCGECYEEAVESFKDYVDDRICERYGRDLYDVIEETVDNIIEDFD